MAKGFPKLTGPPAWKIAPGSTWSRELRIMLERLRVLEMPYRDYVLTVHWRALSSRLKKPACEVCGSRRSLALHHITYVRLGRERDEDMVTVCGSCHESVHRLASSGPYSLDPRISLSDDQRIVSPRPPVEKRYRPSPKQPAIGPLSGEAKLTSQQQRERYQQSRTDGKNPIPPRESKDWREERKPHRRVVPKGTLGLDDLFR